MAGLTRKMSMAMRGSMPLLALLLLPWTAQAGQCPPAGWDRPALETLAHGGFELDDDGARQGLALGLLDCLAAPDPALRDGIAFEAISHWARAGQLDRDTRATMLRRLLPWLADGDDRAGFRAPFAALVLSEVARTDRIEPWLAPGQRQALAAAAARYLAGVRDYRGFDEQEGWRHGVAHGADLALQLALNPALDGAQARQLLDAVGSQVAPADGHAYVFGEPERLLRPVLYLARGGAIDAAAWDAWFARLSSPAPAPDWGTALRGRSGLARRHDLRAFLLAMYAETRESEVPEWQDLARRSRTALEKLP